MEFGCDSNIPSSSCSPNPIGIVAKIYRTTIIGSASGCVCEGEGKGYRSHLAITLLYWSVTSDFLETEFPELEQMPNFG